MVALNTETGVAEVALAGHPAPLAQMSDGTIHRLWAPPNVPLGLHERDPYGTREHTLPSGAVLVLQSDGLHELERDDAWARLDALG